ncbi:MAG: hypothetical protein OZ921_08535 [Sorangiineae bacterium]|nr:hypothetical protein [Polyangiaceae bacterium]MEB2322546.1 hypothetical protein [Sorangiineae bacterium]
MRAVTAEEPGQRAGTKPAKEFEKLLPEALQRGGRGRAKRRASICFGPESGLRPVESTHGRASNGRDRRDPMSKAPVTGVGRRIEHVRQTGPQVAGDEPTKDLEQEMLGALILGFGEGVAPTGEGSDCSMGSSV